MQDTLRLAVQKPGRVITAIIIGIRWLFAIAAAICSYVALTISGATSALALVLVPIALVLVEDLGRVQPTSSSHPSDADSDHRS